MRAAKLLQAIERLNLTSAPSSSSSVRRLWPCFEAKALSSQAADDQVQLKLPADMTADEQAAAAAVASAWVAEMARGQELIASLLTRAQRAEMGLAAAKLAADGKQQPRAAGEADARFISPARMQWFPAEQMIEPT